jgi:hypothetical protein
MVERAALWRPRPCAKHCRGTLPKAPAKPWVRGRFNYAIFTKKWLDKTGIFLVA